MAWGKSNIDEGKTAQITDDQGETKDVKIPIKIDVGDGYSAICPKCKGGASGYTEEYSGIMSGVIDCSIEGNCGFVLSDRLKEYLRKKYKEKGHILEGLDEMKIKTNERDPYVL